MPQEDVTQPGPLKGGRQRANHIQVHRIELGLTERKYVETAALAAFVPTIAIVAGGAGVFLAGFALYQWLKDGIFSDILSPKWRDDNLFIWSDEQRAIYREENPSMWNQIFDGPAIFWQFMTNPGPPPGGQDTD